MAKKERDGGAYFAVLAAYLGATVVYEVASNGIIYNNNASSPEEIEQGYFLPYELRDEKDASSSEEMAKVPLRFKKAEQLKALPWPPSDSLK